MALVEFAVSAVGRATQNLRRRVAAYAAAGVLFVAATLYAAAAALIALEQAIGPVGARLVLAGLCVLAGAAILYFMLRQQSPGVAPFQSADASSQEEGAAVTPRHLQLAMIVEALLLGFSMSRKKSTRRR